MKKLFVDNLDLRLFSLRTQIGLAIGLILSLTLLIYSLVLFSAVRGELQQSLSGQLEVLVSSLAAELDDKVLIRVDVLESMAKKFPIESLNDPLAVERHFRNSPALHTLIDDLYLFSAQGVLLIDWPPAPGRRGLDMTERDYIQGAIKQGRTTISKPILGKATKQPIVVISVPIFDEHRKMVGILGGVVNLQRSRLLEPLSSTKVGQSGYFYLVGQDRLTIMHPDKNRVLQRITEPGINPSLDKALEENFEGTVEGVNSRGLPGLFSFKRLPSTQWVLAAVQPSAEAFETIDTLRERVILSTIITLVLAIAITALVVRRFTQPLEILANFLKSSRTLSLPPTLPHHCKETDNLSTAFSEFIAQQKITQDELFVARLAAEAANADLRIAAIAFEAQEGMFITNAENIILRVNNAFVQITGYTASEIVGQTPSVLASGRHDAKFYIEMKDSINKTNNWQGEIWNRRKNGEIYPQWLTITAVTNSEGILTNYVSTLTDISQRKAAEQKIQYLAFYDPLTHLPNRRLLIDRLQQALASSAHHQEMGALLFIDLDNFKVLNDTLGHEKGDLLLQQVAERLTTCMRKVDSIARLGGDEFVVVLENLSSNVNEAVAQTETAGGKILAALSQPYSLEEIQYHNTVSIGVSMFATQSCSVDDLMKQADLAMYNAKKCGRNALRFFDPEMQAEINARMALEKDMRDGLAERQFILYYQPQVDGNGHIQGMEALIRWQHPKRGTVSPATFIPLAEETGIIIKMGYWVLESACDQLVKWSKNLNLSGLSIAINISARQFREPEFVDQVLDVIKRTGANPCHLKLELTESLLLDNAQEIINKMSILKAQGISFSLDDFGTGYSSLSYLKRLPLDQLKIDQSFVRDLLTDSNDVAIVRTIVALAQSLGLAVIAEGVENQAQRDCLANQGCLAYQGYLFGRPMPAEELEKQVIESPMVSSSRLLPNRGGQLKK